MNNYKSKNNKPNVGVVGATGLVGRTILTVLEEQNIEINELLLFASTRSAGEKIQFRDKEYIVQVATPDIFKNLDFALFSAGSTTSLELAPYAAKDNCIVIDNSSAFRMGEDIPLVVPEVNPDDVNNHKNIIANPNCSTIQLVSALKPISDNYGIKRLVCSTYQSISGAGQTGIDKLFNELEGKFDSTKQIAFSTLFHSFDKEDTFTNEEIKMINETRKILHIADLPVAVTCVRIPTIGGHGESVNLELEKSFEINDIVDLLSNTKGIVLMDSPEKDVYPTPAIANGTDFVYVGRVRRDDSVENGLYLWVVADNIRKGAATNAVQILKLIMENRK